MRLKLLEFNVQDLFLTPAYPVGRADLEVLAENEWQLLAPTDETLKPLAKLRGLAQVFRDLQPDVAMLCEVGGRKSLKNLCKLVLDDAYEPYLIAGNSNRGIDNGFLVRRGLPLTAELKSHRRLAVPFLYAHEQDPAAYAVTAAMAAGMGLEAPKDRKLSRDIPELRLTHPDGRLAAVLLLAHLKSGYDPDGIDPGGAVRRGAEAKALIDLYAATVQAVGADVPVIVAGDLNGTAARAETSPELAAIYEKTDLEDVLELKGLPTYERITHVTYTFGGGHARQLDYVFVPRRFAAAVDLAGTGVYRYRLDGGGDAQLPGSMRDRRELPSDHYPVYTTLVLAD